MANKPTGWGKVSLLYGTPTSSQEMATTLVKMGDILENSLSIEQQEGTKLQLYAEGHILKDELQLEGTNSIKATLIGIPEDTRKKFWATDNAGETVSSMITASKFSIKLVPHVLGAETLSAPYCSINLGMAYSSQQGWTAPVTVTILQNEAGKFFEFGTVIQADLNEA